MNEPTLTLTSNHHNCDVLLVLHELLTRDLEDTVRDLLLGLRIPEVLLSLLEELSFAGAFDEGARDGWTDCENRFMDSLWEVHQAYMVERSTSQKEVVCGSRIHRG